MKRKIIASIIGVAACAAATSSYGQGSFIFGNYSLGAVSYFAPVTISGGPHNGLAAGPSYTAALLYSSTGLAVCCLCCYGNGNK